ncbi:MAG: amino acid adenylation domain-containing protein, partial [Bradymonadaceae bacterium]
PVHRLFERRVEKHPGRIAQRFDGGEWSYEELNRRANRLAHRLQEAGVGRNDVVGVSMERSPALVAALLGVLKTGAAYTALEPSSPAERLRYIVGDAEADVIVCDDSGREAAEWGPERTIVSFDSRASAGTVTDNPGVSVEPQQVAYVLYTSGTTGRPKGVRMSHRGLASHVVAFRQGPYGGDERTGDSRRCFLFHSSYGFDASVTEIYPPLIAGDTVAIAPPDISDEPSRFGRVVARQGVTDLLLTPTQLEMLVELAAEETWTRLQRVYTAGEALTEATRQKFFEVADAKLANLYGVTEMCCGQTMMSVTPHRDGATPIGEPQPNYEVCVASSVLEPMPVGVSGEICIAGSGEADGYWQMPRATAMAFVPNPWDDRSGARVYCTGDLARWQPDGNLEYLGRIDHQVQLRGNRLELE